MKLPPHVYIVDDDRMLLASVGAMLQGHGVPFTSFEDGGDFLDESVLLPGCLLLDLKMVTVGGLDVLRELERRKANLCIIVISSIASVKIAIEAMKLGSHDLLEKPFDEMGLVEAMKQAWARYSSNLDPRRKTNLKILQERR